jgi:hypothetical protein
LYKDDWKARKFSVGDRRILLTHWVMQAWNTLYKLHKEIIIKAFQQVGLSLNPDGSKD